MTQKSLIILLLIITIPILLAFGYFYLNKKETAKINVEIYNEAIPPNFVLAENSFSKVKYPSDWSWTIYKDAERIKFSNPENSIEFSINKNSSFLGGSNTSLAQRKKNEINILENINKAAANNTSPNVVYDRNVEIINASDIEVNGVRGYQVLYSGVSGTNSNAYKNFFIELEKNGNFYQVLINIDADKYDGLMDIIKRIISSIEII